MSKLLKILIVEDNPINTLIINKLIAELCTTHSANSGQNALKMLTENDYDLVLMDINLGDEHLTGIDVLKKIKASQRNQDIPVIAVTAISDQEELKQLLFDGFDEIISKPVNREKIFSAIKKYIVI
ncbi:MAG: response regulator [Bacteroidetes bacterium]|nr:MAG: response regulator [Bacteroidota bacterium]